MKGSWAGQPPGRCIMLQSYGFNQVAAHPRFPDFIARLVPDAITASVILTLAMLAIALALGTPSGAF